MKRLRNPSWLQFRIADPLHRPSRFVVALLSFVVAATIVYLAMPSSRPYFTEAWHRSKWDVKLNQLSQTTEGITVLEQKGPMAHALAVRIAAGEILKQDSSSASFAKIGLQLTQRGEKEQPENGFWPQMAASFEASLGHKTEALDQWKLAASKSDWQDLQAAYLLSQFPTNQQVPSYVYAKLLRLRTDSASKLVFQTAQDLWAKQYLPHSDNVEFQFDTLLNGYLIRKHAKSLHQMEAGINICSLILLPPNSVNPPGYHAMLVARLQLADSIRKSYPLSVVAVDTMFRENDAEAALTSSTDIPAEKQRLSRITAVVSCLPGAILASIPTLLILGLFGVFGKFAHTGSVQDRPKRAIIFIAIVSAFAAGFVPLSAAITLVAASFFFLANTKNARKNPPDDLGPLFRYTMVLLGILWVMGTTIYFVLASYPGQNLLQFTPIDPLYLSTGSVALILSALFVSSTMWGFAQRIPTEYVLKKGVRLVWVTSFWAALIAAVIAVPICAREDKIVSNNLQNMVANEPLYFLAK